jgi:hypothetical protein
VGLNLKILPFIFFMLVVLPVLVLLGAAGAAGGAPAAGASPSFFLLFCFLSGFCVCSNIIASKSLNNFQLGMELRRILFQCRRSEQSVCRQILSSSR